jgi:hypothetical protein
MAVGELEEGVYEYLMLWTIERNHDLESLENA